MTSNDHTHDALIAALRAPARLDELAGEAEAVEAMVAALQPVPARPGSRSRRGLVLAAVTVASLGVGGLAAAGPGIFTAPFTGGSDRTRTDDESLSIGDDSTERTGTVGADGPVEPGATADGEPANGGTHRDGGGPPVGGGPAGGDQRTQHGSPQDGGDDTDVECADGNHGATVREVATSSIPGDRGASVSEAARSDCGKPADGGSTDDGTTPGRSGDAPGRSGDDRGVGNDGTPGPPTSTSGQGRPPAAPGPPADPGQGNSNTNQGQPPANPAPPTNPGQGNSNTNQGQPPANPAPPASQPGQGNGPGKPGTGG